MGIRSLIRATATAYAMSSERAKSKTIIATLDEAVARIYANADTGFAPAAVLLNVPDHVARAARDPKVIAATSAIKALRTRAFEATLARNPEYELNLAACAVPLALDDLSKALRDAYARVLFVGQTLPVSKDGSEYIFMTEVTAVSPFDVEPDEFTGSVRSVFTLAGNEIDEGAIAGVKGEEYKFNKRDIRLEAVHAMVAHAAAEEKADERWKEFLAIFHASFPNATDAMRAAYFEILAKHGVIKWRDDTKTELMVISTDADKVDAACAEGQEAMAAMGAPS